MPASKWSDETKYIITQLDKVKSDLEMLRVTVVKNHEETKGELKGLKGKVAVVASIITVTVSSGLTALLKKMHII